MTMDYPGYIPLKTGVGNKPLTVDQARKSLENLPKGDVEQSIRDLNEGRGK